jgi:hypothetical protein
MSSTSFVSLAPLRAAAIQLGRLNRGERDLASLPVDSYRALVALLNDSPRHGNQGARRLSQEGAMLVARALLLGAPLAAATFLCVSDYVGGQRLRLQGGQFALTPGEQLMFVRAERLRAACAAAGVALQWRLVLADAWGIEIFRERVQPGALNAYCALLADHCDHRNFDCLRWSRFMAERESVFAGALAHVDTVVTDAMVRWEATAGEIAHDKVVDKSAALAKARQHIRLRAAEGPVLVAEYGPMLVLSTESRRLQRYDNLVVPRAQYAGHDFMPKYPHRLDG